MRPVAIHRGSMLPELCSDRSVSGRKRGVSSDATDVCLLCGRAVGDPYRVHDGRG